MVVIFAVLNEHSKMLVDVLRLGLCDTKSSEPKHSAECDVAVARVSLRSYTSAS